MLFNGVEYHLVGTISNATVIASGRGVRIKAYLDRTYGKGRWRKLKGIAIVRDSNDTIWRAELHWYEAHGIGRRDMKIKQLLE